MFIMQLEIEYYIMMCVHQCRVAVGNTETRAKKNGGRTKGIGKVAEKNSRQTARRRRI